MPRAASTPRGLVLAEAAALTAAAFAGGALVGWALSGLLVKALTGVFDPPPVGAAVPWHYLLLTAAATVTALAVAAVNAARRSTRPPVEELREL
ncbi:FtsX-like permease family protein [Streptomyces sp. NPDC046557]|uniref:FtsX-like permease family protein n=1 Tax=Streptomyces sp. NPDC046557 TaxID=3155372 RepID=UPI0033DCD2BF